MGAAMATVLYSVSRESTFIQIDREALAERFEVVEYSQPGPIPRPRELWRKLRECDVVYAWFATWHTLATLVMARMQGKPTVVVTGGFDTASLPDIGYGSQRGGVRRWMARWIARHATRLVTNSDYLVGEIEENLGIPPDAVRVVHHGLRDRFAGVDVTSLRPPAALTVGHVYRLNLERKGHRPFVRAARELPDVRFTLAGDWYDDTIESLRAEAPPNVEFTGFLPDPELDELFRQSAVYVQASLHEGFGLALAEAMLAGAVPVVTPAGALPEVVGDVGVTIAEPTPSAIAAGVERALEMGPGEGARARQRILERFTFESRRDGICEAVEAALRDRHASS
jgi:glycosyltransferase involved in cell wall biosynthesis